MKILKNRLISFTFHTEHEMKIDFYRNLNIFPTKKKKSKSNKKEKYSMLMLSLIGVLSLFRYKYNKSRG